MTVYDVYNGDADGICARLQMRLAHPDPDAVSITGVKRDIALLRKVNPADGDRINVLDVSLDKNRHDLLRVLESGATVHYYDHHFAGEVPEHPALTAHINTQPNVCTSILMNTELAGAHVDWAIVGTLGDNLDTSARELGRRIELTEASFQQLKRLGVCINYNGYGATEDDLHFPPGDLFQRMLPYQRPADFLSGDPSTFERLETGYEEDLTQARKAPQLLTQSHAVVVLLPDAPWARRVSGVYGNLLANQSPDCAHAVVTEGVDGYLVSVRAPLNRKNGADEICRQFVTGGGRKAAAGINQLPHDQLDQFLLTFSEYYLKH